jgi:serine kinase of HPr protein (carbohydrate metabolism regulator)
MIRHAGLIADRIDGRWRGALIEGPSASGKSDLALRAIAMGMRLVADDQTEVFASGRRLFGKAPASISGLIEARGVGIARINALEFAEIVLLVRCTGRDDIERLPQSRHDSVCGVELPVLSIWPFEASAQHKMILALQHLGARPHQAYQARFAALERRARR